MERIPPIKAVMTPFPHAVGIDDSIEMARQTMRTQAIRHLAVTEKELTERLDRVLLAMSRSHLGSALVVKRGKLVGIFTTSDACRIFGECLRNLFPNDDDEAA